MNRDKLSDKDVSHISILHRYGRMPLVCSESDSWSTSTYTSSGSRCLAFMAHREVDTGTWNTFPLSESLDVGRNSGDSGQSNCEYHGVVEVCDVPLGVEIGDGESDNELIDEESCWFWFVFWWREGVHIEEDAIVARGGRVGRRRSLDSTVESAGEILSLEVVIGEGMRDSLLADFLDISDFDA